MAMACLSMNIVFDLPHAMGETQTADESNPTFGAELSFWRPEIEGVAPYFGTRVDRAHRAIVAKFTKLCRAIACSVEKIPGKEFLADYRIRFQNGFYIDIGADFSVIEIKTKPSTIGELRHYAEFIQTEVFDRMAAWGFVPHETLGMGHVHMGLESAFHGNDRLLRDFCVYFENHPEMIALFGGINYDPTIAERRMGAIEAFRKVIADFDAGKIREIPGLIRAIQDQVYRKFPGSEPSPDPVRESAMNLSTANPQVLPESRTIEFRKVRPQRNVYELIAFIELKEAIRKKAAAANAPIPVEIEKNRLKWPDPMALIRELDLPEGRYLYLLGKLSSLDDIKRFYAQDELLKKMIDSDVRLPSPAQSDLARRIVLLVEYAESLPAVLEARGAEKTKVIRKLGGADWRSIQRLVLAELARSSKPVDQEAIKKFVLGASRKDRAEALRQLQLAQPQNPAAAETYETVMTTLASQRRESCWSFLLKKFFKR